MEEGPGVDPNSRKRDRNDSEELRLDSTEAKLTRFDSLNSDAYDRLELNNSVVHLSDSEINRIGSDNSGINSPEAKRFQDDLLNILDDADEPAIQGLESVIRSFEEEILVPHPDPDPVLAEGDVTSDSGGPQPVLCYLLGASDDELGLPPTFFGDGRKVEDVDLEAASGSGAVGLGEISGLENQVPSYDSFDEFTLVSESCSNIYHSGCNDSGEFVSLGGPFDFPDDNSVPADIGDMTLKWQPKSLSAK